ncbi:MAG: AzlD domain-containing protein [Bacteroidota bacterium]
MSLWLVMIAGGLITYAIRLSFIYLSGRMETPEAVRRGLRFVPPAVLSAILVPELLIHAGKVEVSAGNERLLAGLAAILAAWVTRNTVLTIAVGMGVLVLLRLAA